MPLNIIRSYLNLSIQHHTIGGMEEKVIIICQQYRARHISNKFERLALFCILKLQNIKQ